MAPPSDVRLPVYLLKKRQSPRQRTHFALFIPYATSVGINPIPPTQLELTPVTEVQSLDGGAQGDITAKEKPLGHEIHVVGAPMAGFGHEFVRNYSPHDDTNSLKEAVLLGTIDPVLICGPDTGGDTEEIRS